ncbi:hypothetical protein [Paraburkholderia youngii]|uniref:hypothetical protein n=1 Tax=Paraburkholderia youngii TaxID=2782701 RepID=UPI003D2124E7
MHNIAAVQVEVVLLRLITAAIEINVLQLKIRCGKRRKFFDLTTSAVQRRRIGKAGIEFHDLHLT